MAPTLLPGRDRCLAVLIRHPEPGKVKTRLALTHGNAFAAELYGCFIDDLLEALAPGNYSLELFFTPADREPDIRRRFGGFPCTPQQGEGLGTRMENAFRATFARGFATTVLIGSDSPDLTVDVIEGAFAALEQGHDAVVGPAFDGGYYLIGFGAAAFCPEVFRDMAWGESSVCRETLERLRTRGLRIQQAPPWHDIDRAEDLAALRDRHADTPFRLSRTMTFLRSRPEVLAAGRKAP